MGSLVVHWKAQYLVACILEIDVQILGSLEMKYCHVSHQETILCQ